METVAILLWVMFVILVLGAVSIIGLHSYVTAKAYQKHRLNPWHITGLSVALCGFALVGVLLIPNSFSFFLLGIFISCTLISYVAFGIVIHTLLARLRGARV